MNIALDYVKERWAATQNTENVDPKTHAEVVTLCCAIKALVGWHIGQVTTTSRERCGGQVSLLEYSVLICIRDFLVLNSFVQIVVCDLVDLFSSLFYIKHVNFSFLMLLCILHFRVILVVTGSEPSSVQPTQP